MTLIPREIAAVNSFHVLNDEIMKSEPCISETAARCTPHIAFGNLSIGLEHKLCLS